MARKKLLLITCHSMFDLRNATPDNIPSLAATIAAAFEEHRGHYGLHTLVLRSQFYEGKILTIMGKLRESRQRSNIPQAQKVSAHYLQTLLAAIPKTSGTTLSTSKNEHLSERELEVLRLIAEGLSNKAIAKRLELAPSTVKWHVNELFGKLEVRSRTQAIARANALHLL